MHIQASPGYNQMKALINTHARKHTHAHTASANRYFTPYFFSFFRATAFHLHGLKGLSWSLIGGSPVLATQQNYVLLRGL